MNPKQKLKSKLKLKLKPTVKVKAVVKRKPTMQPEPKPEAAPPVVVEPTGLPTEELTKLGGRFYLVGAEEWCEAGKKKWRREGGLWVWRG